MWAYSAEFISRKLLLALPCTKRSIDWESQERDSPLAHPFGKRVDVAGMLRHDFRRYESEALPPQIDPERMELNRVLCGDAAALDDLPRHQPDTGRKIRKDANVAASMICTLPQELDPADAAAVDAWVAATMRWAAHAMPWRGSLCRAAYGRIAPAHPSGGDSA